VAILRTKPIVDIQNVVIVIIIIAVIMYWCAWFSENTTGIVRGLVTELGIADVVGVHEMSS
jgi:hypothetical protein